MTEQYPVLPNPSAPPPIAGGLTTRVAVPPGAAVDLDERFSAVITRLTIAKNLSGGLVESDLRRRALRGSQRAPAADLPFHCALRIP